MLRACLLGLLAVTCASAAPKVALVRVADVYRQLPATREMAQQVDAKRKALLQDPRLTAYHEVRKELETLREKLAESAELEPMLRERIERNFALKRQEALTLQREYEEFRKARLKQINAEMVATMEKNLLRVRETSARIASERGYDWLLDASGNTNTGMPFVLYAKDPSDITSAVLTTLVPGATGSASNR